MWTFEPWWRAVAAMHRAFLLPRNVCVCVFLEKHTGRERLRRANESEEEWRSLTYSSFPCKRAAAIQMSQNPYTDECSEKWISRQIFWRIHTVDGYQQVQRNFVSDRVWLWQRGRSFAQLWTDCRQVTGWPSKRLKVKSSVSGQTARPQVNKPPSKILSRWRI